MPETRRTEPVAGAGSALDQALERVLGAKTGKALERAFGLHTIDDLLQHYPRRYAHRGQLTPIASLTFGVPVTIVAEVVEVRERDMRARRGRITEVRITDGHGTLTLTFFNQPWRAAELLPGVRGVFSGKITEYRGSLQLAHPDYELFRPADASDAPEAAAAAAEEWATRPLPIYPATASLPSWRIAQAIAIVLDGLAEVPELLPAEVREAEQLLDHRAALEAVHRPTDDQQREQGQRTVRFEEAYVLQVALLRAREVLRLQRAQAFPLVADGLVAAFDAGLPYARTAGQIEVGEVIARELAGEVPMNRLLQGEVGSGKTLVAVRAMLQVADAGGQAALIAPTEVLAAQHLASLHSLLGPDLWQRVLPTLITGSLPAAERRHAALAVASGQSRLIVGTHALLSDKTQFEHLGLVVVDEQHRFGVEQREALKAKGIEQPHVLMLTATPIPRTVAMSVFGDLDISSLHELPAGRQPIASFVVPLAEHPAWLVRVWQRIVEEVQRGRQAYVVTPLIDQAEVTAASDEGGLLPEWSVERVVELLGSMPGTAHLRVAALHGRMKADEREQVMRDFAERRLDVLVATTVIEVGVNVPNASLIAVLDADRFGVAQLHQLRGRVGRGEHPSVALFVTKAEEGTPTRARIDAVAATTDGFELAELDLMLRREGDVLGASQSGARSQLKALRVTRDGRIIARARELAEAQLAAGRPISAALERALDRALNAASEHYLSAS